MESVGYLNPNKHTIQAVVKALKAQLSEINGFDHQNIDKSELDSHANMIVLGKEYFIFESTGKTCNVQPFSDEFGAASDVPIVDAALAYDCPFTNYTYILIVRNALHIASMNHNLTPPFIMREGGVTANDIPNMYCSDPK